LERIRARKRRRRLRADQKGGPRCELLEYYAAQAGIKPLPKVRDERVIDFPRLFSFIESPSDAIDVLGKLVRLSLRRRTHKIRINQVACEQTDHCAQSAAGALAVTAHKELRVTFGGVFPRAQDQRDIAIATGLPRRLGVSLPPPPGFLTFELFHGRRMREKATVSSQREEQTSLLTEYVNECLARYDYRLNRESAGYVASLVSEVIGNAEDHAGRPDWWVGAYLRQASDTTYGDCHITIFNFGRTLAQSLQDLPADSMLRRDIEDLVTEHTKRGLFRPHWTPENLWTLYALQEGVSRHNTRPDKIGDRGQGTADMIRFFQHLGKSRAAQSEPRMCVVSGRTHILFDGRFEMRLQVARSGERRRIIAFNKRNDLQLPPDPACVRNLEAYFPGTLISLRFYLDHEHLSGIE
jgi:hypothetical protein